MNIAILIPRAKNFYLICSEYDRMLSCEEMAIHVYPNSNILCPWAPCYTQERIQFSLLEVLSSLQFAMTIFC